MKHLAGHPLPVSTGMSGGKSRDPATDEWVEVHPTVWCGRCHGSFEIDQDWVDRRYRNGMNQSERKRILAVGLRPPSAAVHAKTKVQGRDPRPASQAPFPYGSSLVAYVSVVNGHLKQVTYAEACALAQGGHSVYGAWPGQYSQDVFLLDDLAAR